MGTYGLFSRGSNEPINKLAFINYTSAKFFFEAQKKLSQEKFDEIFEVREIK